MMLRKKAIFFLFASLVIVWLAMWQRALIFSRPVQSATVSGLDDSTVSLRVRFGVKDTKPIDWSGALTATAGEILSVRNWHPRPGDELKEDNTWVLSTRKGPNFRRRAWEEELPAPPGDYLLIPGLVVDARTSAGTVLHFKTAQGVFDLRPADLPELGEIPVLNGSVMIDRVAVVQKLSAEDYENDFPSLLGSSDATLWTTWVAYRNGANEVLARHFDGSRWSTVQQITTAPSDVFLAKLGRDARGHVWIVWSAQENRNWDLYARRYDGRNWSAVEQLTNEPEPDLFHNLTTAADGTLWLAWQGFRNGQSDIFVRRFDGNKWLPAERLSASPRNDWEPAIAADSTGCVYVGWDTYDKGNYDVIVRRFAASGWEEPVAIADSLKFEAHVSLTCDRENRLWAAWNESGTQWGKDSGFLVKKEATRLYQWRSIGTAVYDGRSWQEPVADLNQSLPADYNDFPSLHADESGRVWLFFRHRTLKFRDTHHNTPAHRAAWEIFGSFYSGDGWSPPAYMPFSQGRTDMRAGFATDGSGRLYAAWPTDNRDFEDFFFKHADVYVGRVPLPQNAVPAPKLKPRQSAQLTIFPVHPKEAEDLNRIRSYAIQSEGKTYRIWRGDTHRHTEFSMDGNNEGSLFQTYRYALDAVDLDFLGVSDRNNNAGPDIEYVNWLLQQACDLFFLPSRFVPLYGYERSLSYPNGHRNVFFAVRGNPTLPISEEERKGEEGAARLFAYLKRLGGIAISHTSASNMGTDWRDNDPEVEPLVEIYQGDRVSAEYEGAPKAAHAGNPASAPGGFRPAGYVWNAWAKGYKLGIQASSDHLSNHISYACTIAEDFTRDGLLDAMRRRHSYAATDNIVLDYRLKTEREEHLQGDIVERPGEFRLWVKVLGTAPVRQIDIVRSNQFIHTTHPLKQEVELTFLDQYPLPGESYYYVRILQVDDQMAWSSPIWVRR